MCSQRDRKHEFASSHLVNYLLYQVGWFACVAGVAFGFSYLGTLIAVVLLGLHLYMAGDRKTQVMLMITAVSVGLVVDLILINVGALSFPIGGVAGWMPPFFMSVLWMQFASTFRYCLGWLSHRYLLSSLLGAVGAPLAFAAGERLGVVEFLQPRLIHFAFLATLWAVAIPLLVGASDQFSTRLKGQAIYRLPFGMK